MVKSDYAWPRSHLSKETYSVELASPTVWPYFVEKKKVKYLQVQLKKRVFAQYAT